MSHFNGTITPGTSAAGIPKVKTPTSGTLVTCYGMSISKPIALYYNYRKQKSKNS